MHLSKILCLNELCSPIFIAPISYLEMFMCKVLSFKKKSIKTIDELANLAENLRKFAGINAMEFMNWAYLVINNFHIIFTENSNRPRDDEQVTFIYTLQTTNSRDGFLVGQFPGTHTKLQSIPMYEIRSVWKVLKRVF